MRIAGVLILVFGMMMGIGSNLPSFVDAPSLIIIFAFVLGVLLMSGTSVGSMFAAVFTTSRAPDELASAARGWALARRASVGRRPGRHVGRRRHHAEAHGRHRCPWPGYRHRYHDGILRPGLRLRLLSAVPEVPRGTRRSVTSVRGRLPAAGGHRRGRLRSEKSLDRGRPRLPSLLEGRSVFGAGLFVRHLFLDVIRVGGQYRRPRAPLAGACVRS